MAEFSKGKFFVEKVPNGHLGFPIKSEYPEGGSSYIGCVYLNEMTFSAEKRDEWAEPANKESRFNATLFANAGNMFQALTEIMEWFHDADVFMDSREAENALRILNNIKKGQGDV